MDKAWLAIALNQNYSVVMATKYRQALTKYTGLARSLDLKNRCNQYALFITFVAFLLSSGIVLLFPNYYSEGLLSIPKITLYVFTVWALAREFDPDRVRTAYVAPALSLLILTVFPFSMQATLLILALVIVLARMITRSTGVKLSIIDSGLILIFTSYLTLLSGNWIIPLFVSISFLFDFLLSRGHQISGVFSVVSALMSLMTIWANGVGLPRGLLMAPAIIILFFLSVVYVLNIVAVDTETISLDDMNQHKIDRTRLLAARIVLLWVAVTLTLQQNLTGFRAFSGLWIIIALLPIFAFVPKLLQLIDEETKKSL